MKFSLIPILDLASNITKKLGINVISLWMRLTVDCSFLIVLDSRQCTKINIGRKIMKRKRLYYIFNFYIIKGLSRDK